MSKRKRDIYVQKKENMIALCVELFLTLMISVIIIFVSISDLKNTAQKTTQEVDDDYNLLIKGYMSEFNIMTTMAEEKIEQDYSFEEMLTWLQSKEEDLKNGIDADIYDGFAFTYKGGYVRSWSYGDYSDYDPTTRPWYQQAQKANGRTEVVAPYVTYLDTSYLDSDEYILMSIVKRYNDEISFDYDIKIKDIQKLLTERKFIYDSSHAILIDADGYVLSSNQSDEFAHNINQSDDVITSSIQKAVLRGKENEGELFLQKVEGEMVFTYAEKDSHGNMLFIFCPLSEVIQNNLMVAFMIVFFLILLELYLYYTNKKRIMEFNVRDKRLSAISDVAYKEHIYVDVDDLTFHGSEKIQNLVKSEKYEVAYHAFLYLASDDESKQKMHNFLSPEVIKVNRTYDGNVTSETFNICSKHADQEQLLVYEVFKICSVIDRKKTMTLLCNDITEDAQQLKVALHDAKAANRAKTEFLSRMSHDIRTPMNAIIGMTHLAKEEENPGTTQEYLENIDSSSQFLLGLINDILDLSKIESGELELHPEVYTVIEFEKSIRTIIQPLMDAKNIHFIFKMATEAAPSIIVDRLRFNQIFFNLLSNAAKFTPEGGTVEFISETIASKEGRFGIRYYVRDNGAGMSEEFLPHIFEAFSQEHVTSANQTGTGLGLPIVKSLVDAMDGTIKVKSKEGKGTEYILELFAPLGHTAEEETMDSKSAVSLKGTEILLAEDNDMNILVAKKLLEKEGCRVTVAHNGQEAVDTFEQSQMNQYDAILMDVRMPVLDGIQATKMIRKSSRADAGKIPIIAMTADAFAEEQQKTLEAGMNYHLSKPVNPSQLYQILQKYIQEYRGE